MITGDASISELENTKEHGIYHIKGGDLTRSRDANITAINNLHMLYGKQTGLMVKTHNLIAQELSMNNKSQDKQGISQHVIALITFLALLPLVYFIPEFVGQFLPAIKWLNVIVVVGIIVPIISYLVMPIANFYLSR